MLNTSKRLSVSMKMKNSNYWKKDRMIAIDKSKKKQKKYIDEMEKVWYKS